MPANMTQCLLRLVETDYTLSDYQADIAPRWCGGCGDTGILTAIQRLCRDEHLPPEKTVFVSGIGCSSRLPHYMNAYGFHGLHGRALPVAEGDSRYPLQHEHDRAAARQPCLSFNQEAGVTHLAPRLQKQHHTTRLLSRSAQPADRDPGRGECLVRRSGGRLDSRPALRHHLAGPSPPGPLVCTYPATLPILVHGDGLRLKPELSRIYRNQEVHDPLDMPRALALASLTDEIPVGVLYRDPSVPCYEDLREAERPSTPDLIRTVLDEEFDKVTIWPEAEAPPAGAE